MGIVYKLKSEIKDFILEKKKVDFNLSCRQLSVLILDKFQIKISKSSVNSVIKEANLSMPVGRRRKKRRQRTQTITKPQEEIKLLAAPKEILVEKPVEVLAEVPKEALVKLRIEAPQEIEGTGVILLKAADYLTGGTDYVNAAIVKQLNLSSAEVLANTEALLYSSLGMNFGGVLRDISSYLNKLQEVQTLSLDILRIVSSVFQEVRCIKVSLSDGSDFYLDGQLYTIWSTPHIPYDFSTTVYNIKSYINKYFQEGNPFLLFMAPGYDTPIKELFDFMLSIEAKEKQVSQLTLYGQRIEVIEIIHTEKKKHFFIFGLWPWQFGHFRRTKIKGEFKPFYFEPLKKEFYLANIEMELWQPKVNKRVTLMGVALKTNPHAEIRLFILSNLSSEKPPEEIAVLYLSHWPNLEEGFQDFSRKIELFTYTANSQRFFSLESLNLNRVSPSNINDLFNLYLKALDLYFKGHFLPVGYEDKDFSTINERFYGLKTRLKEQKDRLLVTFLPPLGYPHLKDLEYCARRVNEREIVFPDGKRLWGSL